jgi:hypothetical protein
MCDTIPLMAAGQEGAGRVKVMFGEGGKLNTHGGYCASNP